MKVFATVAAPLALASAEPEPGYYRSSYGGVAHHPYGGSSYRGRTVYGYTSHCSHYLHKREAEADAEPGYGHYYQPRSYSFGYNVHQSHPGYAHSYQYRSQAGGHYLHKREAEADAEPGYAYSGHYQPSYSVSHYQPRSYSYGYNVHQSHPGYAHSYQSRYQAGGHYLHKREAEAEPGYGYTGHGHSSYRSTGYGHGYVSRATSYVAPTTYGYPSHGYNYGYRSYHH